MGRSLASISCFSKYCLPTPSRYVTTKWNVSTDHLYTRQVTALQQALRKVGWICEGFMESLLFQDE